jgi:hypothetical protein
MLIIIIIKLDLKIGLKYVENRFSFIMFYHILLCLIFILIFVNYSVRWLLVCLFYLLLVTMLDEVKIKVLEETQL